MLFAPVSTDAPIYYRPWGTISLIVVNVVVFLLVQGGAFGRPDEIYLQYGLWHGAGLRPVQWITSNFLHGGIVHLLLNMLFLWAFGLVVEGKIGPGPFLATYFTIAVVESAVQQLCLMWVTPGVSFGASSAIFGLMAMALIWAPRNDITVGYTWIMRTGLIDIPILQFSLWMIVLQVLLAFTFRFHVTSEILHLGGALLGAAIAWQFLRRGWVDCEHWDIFSVMKGRHLTIDGEAPAPVRSTRRLTRDGKPARKKKRIDPLTRKVKHLTRLRGLLHDGKPRAAFDEWTAARHFSEDWTTFESDMVNLSAQLQQAGYVSEALEVHLHFIERFPGSADRVRIEAAELMFRHQKRPHAAMRVVEVLDVESLPQDLAGRLQRLRDTAGKLIDSGHIEIEGLPSRAE